MALYTGRYFFDRGFSAFLSGLRSGNLLIIAGIPFAAYNGYRYYQREAATARIYERFIEKTGIQTTLAYYAGRLWHLDFRSHRKENIPSGVIMVNCNISNFMV